jgi:hypothetical protein
LVHLVTLGILLDFRTFSLDINSVSEICKKFEIGESVWTIDLAYILKEYGLVFSMFTITIGVDQTYAKEVSTFVVFKGTGKALHQWHLVLIHAVNFSFMQFVKGKSFAFVHCVYTLKVC